MARTYRKVPHWVSNSDMADRGRRGLLDYDLLDEIGDTVWGANSRRILKRDTARYNRRVVERQALRSESE